MYSVLLCSFVPGYFNFFPQSDQAFLLPDVSSEQDSTNPLADDAEEKHKCFSRKNPPPFLVAAEFVIFLSSLSYTQIKGNQRKDITKAKKMQRDDKNDVEPKPIDKADATFAPQEKLPAVQDLLKRGVR